MTALVRALALALTLAAAPAALAAPAAKKDAGSAPAPAARKDAGSAPAAAAKAEKPAPKDVATQWREVVAKDAGFSASFPGEPERVAHAEGGLRMFGYGFDQKSPELTIAVVVLAGGPDLAARQKDLLESLTEDGKVERDEAVTLDGRPARALLVASEASRVAVRQLAFDDRSYTLLVRVPETAALPADLAARFFGSFHALPALEPAAASAPEKAEPPVALPHAPATAGFKEFVAKEGFAVAFPGEPEREGDEAAVSYAVNGPIGRCSFAVLSYPLPAEAGAGAGVLDLFASQFTEGLGRGVQRNEPTTVGGFPARALTIANGESRAEIRVVVAGDRIHSLIVGADGATPSDADTKAFFGSFRLVKK